VVREKEKYCPCPQSECGPLEWVDGGDFSFRKRKRHDQNRVGKYPGEKRGIGVARKNKNGGDVQQMPKEKTL